MTLLKTATFAFCAFALASCTLPPEATPPESQTIQEATIPALAPSEQRQVTPSKTKEQKTAKKNPCRRLQLGSTSTLKCLNGIQFKIAFTPDDRWACVTFLPSGETAKLKNREVAVGIEYSNKGWLFREHDHKATLSHHRAWTEKNQCRDLPKKKEHKAAKQTPPQISR